MVVEWIGSSELETRSHYTSETSEQDPTGSSKSGIRLQRWGREEPCSIKKPTTHHSPATPHPLEWKKKKKKNSKSIGVGVTLRGGRSCPGLDLGGPSLLFSVYIRPSVWSSVGFGALTVVGVPRGVCNSPQVTDPVLVQNVQPCRRRRFEQRVGSGPGLWERYHVSNGRRLAQDRHQPVESCLRNSVWFGVFVWFARCWA